MEPLIEKLPPPLKDYLLETISLWMDTLPSESPEIIHLKGNIFKKYIPSEEPNPSLREVALKSFLDSEVACKATNARISLTTRGHKAYADPSILLMASRKIARILGPFKLDEMLDRSCFGPGSTFQCRGTDISKARKFSLTDVTPELNQLARGMLAEYPLWSNSLTDADNPVCPMLEVVPGGRYLTVAKNSSTDRSIIVEPTINSWFQQGIGRMIRNRLRRSVGVDLDDQSVNRRLAQLGSVTDDLATVDLSSASDLISKKLVLDLLPDDWYFWLNATRSHQVEIDGKWIVLEKFSSMGNGFTFDLQSLIFYAISTSITEAEGYNPFWVNVFGDDIIVPSGIQDRFCSFFDSVGFSINRHKSYFKGPFRESCGHDYYLGKNIRAVYLRKLHTMFDLMVFHNRLFEWAERTLHDIKEVRDVITSLFHGFPCRTPPRLGDVGLTSHFDEVCPSVARFGWEGFRVKIAVPIFQRRERHDRFLLLGKLLGSQFSLNFVETREKVPVRFRICDTVSDW